MNKSGKRKSKIQDQKFNEDEDVKGILCGLPRELGSDKLLNKLNQYQQQHPQAYRFWSMATYHFISAFYAGQWAQAEKILTTGFADNETYWQHDSGFSTVVLSPWKDHPLVLEYLKRIDTDRLRARQKFDLL